MAYSSISITMPRSAEAGKRVSASVKVKNLSSGTMCFTGGAILGQPADDYFDRFIGWGESSAWLSAGGTKTFYGTFTMPKVTARVYAHSFWLHKDGMWRLDAQTDKVIYVEIPAAAVILLARKSLYVSPEVEPAVVALLARRDQVVSPPGVALLDKESYAVSPAQVALLDRASYIVSAVPPAEVMLLDKVSQLVLVGEDPYALRLLDSIEQLVLPGEDPYALKLLDSIEQLVLPGEDPYAIRLLDSIEQIVLGPGIEDEEPEVEKVDWTVWVILGLVALAIVITIVIARRGK